MAVVDPYPSAVDLAWAAGFWDGEGSCGRYYRRNGSPDGTLRASLGQAERSTLDRFQSIVGIGKVGPHMGHGKRYWAWQCWRQLDFMLLAFMLWPYLSEPKRAQFSRAMAKDS